MSRETEEKVRLLKALAHHIHRKVPAAEALKMCFEAEGRGGRSRQWRQAGDVLAAEGFVPALLAGGLIGDEAATVLAALIDGTDHRSLSAAIAALAEFLDRG